MALGLNQFEMLIEHLCGDVLRQVGVRAGSRSLRQPVGVSQEEGRAQTWELSSVAGSARVSRP